jgi:CheY-like chemotaxis protein
VDDIPAAIELLQLILENEGFELAFASNGDKALLTAKEFLPDLILLDVMLPGMDGFEICRRLRADPLCAEMPILLVTSLDGRDWRLRGLQAGADDFITKPFDHVELRARIRGITRLNRYRQLLAQRMEFEWIVAESRTGILMLDVDDIIIYANARAIRFLDLPGLQSNLLGSNFLAAARCHHQFTPKKAWDRWPNIPQDKTRQPLFLVRPETDDEAARWLGIQILNGISERRLVRIEDETQSMTFRRDVWKFEGVVAHKLRTPLAGLLGCLGLLKDSLLPLVSEADAELLAAAVASAQRMEEAISGILNKVEHKSPHGGPGFLLDSLPTLAALLFAPQPPEHLTIRGLDPFRGASLSLSAETLEIILRELLENAIKFHPLKSPIIIISLASAMEGRMLLSIQDDGTSLSPEHRELVWTPYFQAEKDFTGEIPGMGLGLSMVRILVEEAGGQCRIINRDDAPGIVVELALPFKPAQQ